MSSLCDFSDTYIVSKGTISVVTWLPHLQPQIMQIKKAIFKIFTSFTDCISKINNTKVDNAKSIH